MDNVSFNRNVRIGIKTSLDMMVEWARRTLNVCLRQQAYRLPGKGPNPLPSPAVLADAAQENLTTSQTKDSISTTMNT